MKLDVIDGATLKAMFKSGASALYINKDAVDALNVFPVPDGDTGSNMYMTFAAASREADKELGSSISKVASAAAMGALMGARGNSGVILSQFFRGLSKGLEGIDSAGPADVARACNEAANTAYKAVMRPVEGTILTVGREAGKGAVTAARSGADIIGVLSSALDEGLKALERSPELLPALKEAGVVDAGGKGLMVAFEGALEYLKKTASGTESSSVHYESVQTPQPTVKTDDTPSVRKTGIVESSSSIEFKYCTEFLIKGTGLSSDAIQADLTGKGDSLLVVGNDTLIHIHIHTNNPGRILEYAVNLGDLSSVKIDNMVEQNERAADKDDSVPKPKANKPLGVVAITVGDGLSNIFRSLGVDIVLEGGQTMNPSIEEIKGAVEATASDNVIILPNNSNVILTAQQVSQLTDIPISVVPTKTIPQGIGAMLSYVPSGDMSEVASSMAGAASLIKTGEVTFAVRNTRYNGLEIAENDCIGLADGEIVVSGLDKDQVALELLKKMSEGSADVITVFYGNDISQSEAENFIEKVVEAFPDSEVELQSGGQPLYYYIVSME